MLHEQEFYNINLITKAALTSYQSPEIKMHILLNVLHTLLMELVRRICLNNKTFHLQLVITFFILITCMFKLAVIKCKKKFHFRHY